jgi:prepilin-type N-terminal cleavage/methylation domain-containing protein
MNICNGFALIELVAVLGVAAIIVRFISLIGGHIFVAASILR